MANNTLPKHYQVDGDRMLHLGEGVSEENTILRYMGFAKFEDFLQDGLRLTRADAFAKDDPFEGEYTDQIYKISQCVWSEKNGVKTTLKDHLKEEIAKVRKLVFVSCWTSSESENVALWKLYGGADNSIAIKTDVKSLKREIEHTLTHPLKEIVPLKWLNKRIVKVKYIDHRTDDNGLEMIDLRNGQILHYKNIGYEYEKEIRVIFDSSEQGREEIGRHIEQPCVISIRPQKLIKEIVVSPFADDRFFQSVKGEAKKHNLEGRVKWSDLKFIPGEQAVAKLSSVSIIWKRLQRSLGCIRKCVTGLIN